MPFPVFVWRGKEKIKFICLSEFGLGTVRAIAKSLYGPRYPGTSPSSWGIVLSSISFS